MPNPTNPLAGTGADPVDLELLKDLERQSIDEIRKLRAHERIDTKIRLVIQPGDSSRLGELRAQAHTSDVSAGGCCAISASPVGVGDIFRLTFDRSQLDIPMVFARCVRCRLLREDAFETAFAFFSPISLQGSSEDSEQDLLS